MHIWGTANPEGLSSGYNGLFLTTEDIEQIVRDNAMDGLPVKIEHKGVDVGKVVTAWNNDGKLDILLNIDEKIFEGDCVGRFVRDNVCRDLSIGYNVALQFSENTQNYEPLKKTFNEVSIVRTGARERCHIHGYTVPDKACRNNNDNGEFSSFF
jgi:phosphoribulokinase